MSQLRSLRHHVGLLAGWSVAAALAVATTGCGGTGPGGQSGNGGAGGGQVGLDAGTSDAAALDGTGGAGGAAGTGGRAGGGGTPGSGGTSAGGMAGTLDAGLGGTAGTAIDAGFGGVIGGGGTGGARTDARDTAGGTDGSVKRDASAGDAPDDGGVDGPTVYPDGGIDPALAGCSDGTREGFLDPARNRMIASCAGGFSYHGLGLGTVDTPACGRAAGNDSANPNGTSCAPGDLCAEGWHVCEDDREVAGFAYAGDCSEAVTAGESAFFTASNPPRTTCVADGLLQGCGTVGEVAPPACAPMTRLSGSALEALPPPWTTDPANLYRVTKPGPEAGGILCCRWPSLDATTGPKLAVSSHVCAITGTTLACWGKNDHGQLGFAGPAAPLPVQVPGEWIAVAAGDFHTCAIKTDGSLWCWGWNTQGAIGQGGVDLQDYPPSKVGDGYKWVAAGTHVTCGIKTSRELWCWGDLGSNIPGTGSSNGVPNQIKQGTTPELGDRVDIAGTSAVLVRHVPATSGVGTTPEGDIVGYWGKGTGSPYAFPTFSTSTSAIFAPRLRALARGKSGLCLNENVGPKDTRSYAVLECTDHNVSTRLPPLPRAVEQVAAGDDHQCAIDINRDLYCIGGNDRGQAGSGTWSKAPSPVETFATWQKVKATQGVWTQLAAGAGITCARQLDDSVWCWGDNVAGGLGDGSTVSRSYPSKVGEAAAAPTCSDGLANGGEEKADCGGPCIPCPTCSDGIQNQHEEGIDCAGECGGNCCGDGQKNQNETDVDCGGDTCHPCGVGKGCLVARDCGCLTADPWCAGACAANLCTTWCADADGDGYGNAGPGCKGGDCDDKDVAWDRDCWIRDNFPATRPSTITVTGTTAMNDQRCVMIVGTSGCLAQNDPPCTYPTESWPATVKLTVDADNQVVVEGPDQDMCSPDYFCGVTGPTCPAPLSIYDVPTVGKLVYFTPRPQDGCRRDTNGIPIPVEQRVNVGVAGKTLTIGQECYTWMMNGESPIQDIRRWTTTITLE